jgi:hypothetical protein
VLEREDAAAMGAWDHGGGFSLDASVRVEAHDRQGLERLLLAQKRGVEYLRVGHRSVLWVLEVVSRGIFGGHIKTLDLSDLFLRMGGMDLVVSGLSGGGLKTLEEITLVGSGFSGPLPRRLPPNLHTLKLERNQFSGTLPTGWAKYKKLETIIVSDNMLNGSLPVTWSTLPNLKVIEFSRNQFSGGIPRAWRRLAKLRELSGISCGLSGPFPRAIHMPPTLFKVWLGENAFTGARSPGCSGEAAAFADIGTWEPPLATLAQMH